MINLVIQDKLKARNLIIHSFYYLLKNVECEISVSNEPKDNALNISYGIEIEKGIYIPVNDNEEFKIINSEKYGKVFVQQIFEDSNIFNFKNEDLIIFSYDIMRVSKYLICLSEEFKISKRDDIGRFLGEYSIRKEYLTIPFFDVNSNIILDAMSLLKKVYKEKDNIFRIILTHDVDSVNSRNKYVFLHNVKKCMCKFDLENITNIIKDIIHNRHKQIKNVINIEKLYEAPSEFYFIAGKKHRLGKRYDLKNLYNEIEYIKCNKFNVVGMHTNFFDYNNYHRIKEQIREIEKKANEIVLSCRNHYLMFDVSESWKALSRAGIKFDMSLGYSDRVGFRAATSRSFIPYDEKTDELISIYEIPLVIMDCTLLEKSLSYEEQFTICKDIIDTVKRNNGTVSILWHDYMFYENKWKKMYVDIVSYIDTLGGKFITSKHLKDEFWKEEKEIKQLMKEVLIR